jgi:hypothetical protein
MSFRASTRSNCPPISVALVLLLALLTANLVIATGCKPRTAPHADDKPPPVKEAVLSPAVAALEGRDERAFVETLSAPLRAALTGNLDMSGPGPLQLAAVLRDARLVAEYDQVRIYESRLNGEVVTFMTVKEGGQWLLAGL